MRQQLRSNIMIFTAALAVSASAVAAPKAKAPVAEPVAEPVAQAPVSSGGGFAIAGAPPANAYDYDGLHLRARLGPSFSSGRLSSSSFNATLPQTMGTWYGGEAQYRMNDRNMGVFYRWDVNSVKYKEIPNTTPSDISQKQEVMSFGVMVKPFDGTDWKNFYFGIGYYFEELEADRPTPAVANGAHTNGPAAVLGYFDNLSGSTFYEVDLSVYYPNYIAETPAVSGYYKNAMMFDGAFKVVLPYTDLLDIAIGAQLRYRQAEYTGTGTRSTIDPSERLFILSVPVELRFRL